MSNEAPVSKDTPPLSKDTPLAKDTPLSENAPLSENVRGNPCAVSANVPPPPDHAQTTNSVESSYTIGDLAHEFGITTRAIRFYEARGLISPQRIGANRIYTKRDRARLIIILRGKNVGFTLEDIGEYLALYDADPSQQAQTQMLLDRIEDVITDLEKKRTDLDRTLGELRDMQARCQTHLQDVTGSDD